VITRTILRPDLRPFQVLSAGLAHNFGHAIYLFARLRPKSDPRLVWAMIRVFGKPEKFRGFTSAIFFKCAPFLRALIESKSNRRQDFGEKLLRSRPVSDAQIDMIKEATLQSSG